MAKVRTQHCTLCKAHISKFSTEKVIIIPSLRYYEEFYDKEAKTSHEPIRVQHKWCEECTDGFIEWVQSRSKGLDKS